jgi:ubiquinone/menaquinone biosynthesis C-methylase UbiE
MPLGKHDIFRNVVEWDDAVASDWAAALELRASAADQQAIRRKMLALAGLRPGDTVVEIGCGVGILLSDCAAAVSPGGRVIGIEPQPVFAARARARLSGLRCDCRTEVRSDSADALEIRDALADACVAQSVLIHLPEPAIRSAIREMARVTRPGGRVVSVDQDGDTWVIDHPDRDITRRIVRFNSDQRFADGWTGRRLRRLFEECGLGNVTVDVWTHADTERPSYLYGSCVRLARAAEEAGYISADQCSRWLQSLDELASRGQFFSSISYFAAVGQPS